MISEDTYEELYEILRLMDKAMVMKIPIDILNTIKEQRNSEYLTRIDKEDLFNENNVKKETFDLLCYLDYHYWMDESKKAEVDRIRQQRFQEDNNQKRKQYNPNALFKRKEEEEQKTEKNLGTSLIIPKESLLVKLKKILLKIFYINRKS